MHANDFPILAKKVEGKRLVYLDNGATTLKPQAVIDAVTHYYTDLGANAHRGDYTLSARVDEAYEQVRQIASDFLGVSSPHSIFFTSGTTDGLNQLCEMVTKRFLKPQDIVLTDETQHASSILPWMRQEVDLRYIPLDKQGRHMDLEKIWPENTKVLVINHVSNVLGYVNDLEKLCAFAHQKGALVIVDGAQGAPHLDLQLEKWDVDFYALSAHKLCGPTGVGLVYGKPDLLKELTPVRFGGESNARYTKEGEISFKSVPFCFESGTQPIEGVLGMGAAMNYLMSIGKQTIHQHELTLKQAFLEEAKDLENLVLYNETADSGIITFNILDKGQLIPSQDVASYFSTLGICIRSGQHCAKLLPDVLDVYGTCRASFYLYNTLDDVHALVEAIRSATLEKCVDIFF